jgi:ribonuclease R
VVTTHLALHQLAGPHATAGGLTLDMINGAGDAGNRAKTTQKRVTRAANKLAIDQLFRAELELAPPQRTVYTATVMGLSETKIYLQLDAPPIEVKLYTSDQATLMGCPLELVGRFELRAAARVIRVGDEVHARVHTHDADRDRWVLCLVTARSS